MNEGLIHPPQFSYPTTNKTSSRIVINALLDRVVDTDGVDSCRTGLHLHLSVVDAGFVVGEKFGQVQRRPAPVEP